MAALSAFTPFNGDGKGPNPEYSDKSKARAENPGKFSGDEKEFDNWVQKLADKFEEDVSTFRNEKSRMIYIITQLEGDAQKAVEVRYRSAEDPFSCVAEMVQVLEAPYHDPNQASTARHQLRQHKFRPGKMNVHWFISEFNYLAQKGGIPKKDWKTTIWEQIPKDLDNSLLRHSKDPAISYENFCSMVADAAYSNQLAFEERQEARKLMRDSPNTRPTAHKRHDNDKPGNHKGLHDLAAKPLLWHHQKATHCLTLLHSLGVISILRHEHHQNGSVTFFFARTPRSLPYTADFYGSTFYC